MNKYILSIVLLIILFTGCTQNNQSSAETQSRDQRAQNPDKVESKSEESKITSIDNLLDLLHNKLVQKIKIAEN